MFLISVMHVVHLSCFHSAGKKKFDMSVPANIPHLSVTAPVFLNINATSSIAPTQFLSDQVNRYNWGGAPSCMGSVGIMQPSTSVVHFIFEYLQMFFLIQILNQLNVWSRKEQKNC